MKHVFTTEGVCEAWVNKTSDWGKGEGLHFADHTKIKSYSTLIGARISDTQFLLLIPWGAPTQTTLRHLRRLESAMMNAVTEVAEVYAFPPALNIKDTEWLAGQAKATLANLNRMRDEMQRCRTNHTATWSHTGATTLIANFRLLCDWAGCKDLAEHELLKIESDLELIGKRWVTQ